MPIAMLRYLMIMHWTDILEIMLFAYIFYTVTAWLAQDKQTNLVAGFYGYCGTFFAVHYLQMQAASSFLFLFSPVFLIFFFIIHQKNIQRNFITHKNIQPAQTQKLPWVEELIKSSLVAATHNKKIIVVIEGSSSLQQMLHAPFFIDTPMHKSLIELLLLSQSFDDNKMLWITQHGLLRALNVSWNTPAPEFEETVSLPAWQQEALLITAHTDALVFASNVNRTFTIIAHGKKLDNVLTNQALSMLHQYNKQYTFVTKGQKNETQHSNTL